MLCASAGEQAKLNDIGRFALEQNIISGLANRLRIHDWLNRHPAIRDEAIDAPLVVIGMFRAGTTFLSQLLDQDPANRALLRWEAGDSVPPPSPADLPRQARASDAANEAIDMLESLNPQMKVVHHEEADGPTECITLLGQDFKSLTWEAMANVPDYSRWLLAADYAVGLRLPPTGAAGAAERRRPRALDVEEPAPRDRARRADRRSIPTHDSFCCIAIRWCCAPRCAA